MTFDLSFDPVVTPPVDHRLSVGFERSGPAIDRLTASTYEWTQVDGMEASAFHGQVGIEASERLKN